MCCGLKLFLWDICPPIKINKKYCSWENISHFSWLFSLRLLLLLNYQHNSSLIPIWSYFTDMLPPVINIVPYNVSKEGNTIVMTCYANSTLPVSFYWVKNEVLVGSSEKRFIIESVARNDSGLYWCLTSNKLGTKKSEKYLLNVLCKFLFVFNLLVGYLQLLWYWSKWYSYTPHFARLSNL